MATIIIDEPSDDGKPFPDTTKQQEVETPAPAPAPVVEELPEKYRGKSAAEIIKMHEEAEKRLGTMGSELGELRKLSDEFVRSTLTKKTEVKEADSTTESTDDDTEYFINPKKAIDRAVEQHPLVKELRQRNSETQQERAQRTFYEKHKDADAIVQDPEFVEWVKKSPVRLQLIREANAFNVEAGDEIFSTWKEIKALKNPPKPTEDVVDTSKTDKAIAEAERVALVRDGTLPSGNANPASNSGGKPIYKRSDLVRMKIYEPERYEANQDEILLAYQEGRVRGQ
jgi:hypothetical protein